MNEEMCECGHGKSKHCKGGVFHGFWRGHGGDYCHTSHCDAPVCECTKFRKAVMEAK